ncbi:hypothetical protein [Streptomyces sp. NPDC059142]|uniref:hypothetical protein n=1 Tax=Streptomyces sp. NPDC059142 TaxID=3346739 RepID=UPI00369AEA32
MISLTDERVRRRIVAGPAAKKRTTRTGVTLVAAAELRLTVSQVLGVDVDLILGPVVGTEGAYARQAREDALADMTVVGFADMEYATALVGLMYEVRAGVIEDIEDEDDRGGYEHDELLLRGWAA